MKIHLIGIGGIGVSALAQYYLSKGHEVSGSDLVASEITDLLKAKGIKINIGNLAPKTQHPAPDLVVYSPAIKPDNPELKYFKDFGVNCLSYPEALGEITKQYFTIAVSGSHGKSTTTAMIGLLLEKAGFDPSVIVGTKVREFNPPAGGSNFRAGKGPYLVIEACEYEDSFLHYFPKIIIITNIDKEHLDYFKNYKNVLESFKKFIKTLQKEGSVVLCADDAGVLKLKIKKSAKNHFYSIKQKKAKEIKNVLKIPGQHNVLNALAALETARILRIPDEISLKSLSEFTGTWRRFEIKTATLDKKRKIIIISDYGHHPTEISKTLKAVREKYPKKRIWCVFQPHQHQRTYYLFNDFVKVFRSAPVNNAVITDIYDVAGREEKGINGKINSENLVKKISKKNVIYLPVHEIKAYIKKNPRLGGIKSGDVLVIMGAGDIYKLVEKF